ncbi:MAG: hypothetical protein ACOC40_02045, partial [Thermoplasmatota archaeon]
MALLAMITGVLTGGFPAYTDKITLLSLLVIMTLSTREVKFTELKSIKGHLKDFSISFLANYLFLTIVLIASAYLIFDDVKIIQGLVVFALVPSAIAVIPFTKMLKGDLELSLISSSLLYLSSLAIVPLVLFLLYGSSIGFLQILRYLFLMIVIPLIVSRVLLKVGYTEREYDKIFVNISFFLLIFGFMGANQSYFFSETAILVPILLIGFIRSIGTASITSFIGKYMKIPNQKLKSYVLFSGYKNGGLAAMLAVALFGSRA